MSQMPNANIVDPVTPSAAQGIGAFAGNLNAAAERDLALARLNAEFEITKAQIKATAQEHEKYQEFQATEAEKGRKAASEADALQRQALEMEAEKQRQHDFAVQEQADQAMLQAQARTAQEALRQSELLLAGDAKTTAAIEALMGEDASLATQEELLRSLQGKTKEEIRLLTVRAAESLNSQLEAVKLQENTTQNLVPLAFEELQTEARLSGAERYWGSKPAAGVAPGSDLSSEQRGAVDGAAGVAEGLVESGLGPVGSQVTPDVGRGNFVSDLVDKMATGVGGNPSVLKPEQAGPVKELMAVLLSQTGDLTSSESVKAATQKVLAAGVPTSVLVPFLKEVATHGAVVSAERGKEAGLGKAVEAQGGTVRKQSDVLREREFFKPLEGVYGKWISATGAGIAPESVHIGKQFEAVNALRQAIMGEDFSGGELKELAAPLGSLGTDILRQATGVVGTPKALDTLDAVAPGRGRGGSENLLDVVLDPELGATIERRRGEVLRKLETKKGTQRSTLEAQVEADRTALETLNRDLAVAAARRLKRVQAGGVKKK